MEPIRRALQGAPQLRSFLLHDVVPTGKQLGGGSYGEVVELRMSGLVCAGKKIYDTLIDPENQVCIVFFDSKSLSFVPAPPKKGLGIIILHKNFSWNFPR